MPQKGCYRTWEAEGRICSKRLGPFIPDLLEVRERQGEFVLEATLKRQLLALSPATSDRLLRPLHAKGLRRPDEGVNEGVR
ncbi:MAG: hypothetical protein ACYC3S_05025 [Chloroflexota bacterium]